VFEKSLRRSESSTLRYTASQFWESSTATPPSFALQAENSFCVIRPSANVPAHQQRIKGGFRRQPGCFIKIS